jgi:GT2 family glycosyltransferase
MFDVSIIIVNWNAQDLLAKCLRCVEATVKQVTYEIIVIDNNSNDGSQEMILRDFPQVKLIANTENAGFAKANNQGMEISQGRYFLLLNSDAFVKDSTIDEMVKFMDTRPEAGMSACQLLYEDGRLQPSCYSFPSLTTEFYTALQLDKLFAKNREFGKYLMTYWDFNDVREVDAIMGAFMLVRKTAVDQVGVMDENFFMYSEETDWCYRFNRQGWETLYNPHVQAIHLWGGSSKRMKDEMFLQLYRSKVQFFRKHYGTLSAFALKLILGFGCLLRIGPGLLYYRRSSDPNKRDKHQAFQKLLQALPAF